jgi:osmotically-inducible protein OsmY
MRTLFRLAMVFAAGAAAMYFFDPVRGRRRRALVRDRGEAVRHDFESFARARSKRAADRMKGAMARTRAAVAGEPVDDERLRDRIRAKLGHLIEHPSAVEVTVQEGRVVLSGRVDAEELDDLLDAVGAMLGVAGVENRLALDVRESDATPRSTHEARH